MVILLEDFSLILKMSKNTKRDDSSEEKKSLVNTDCKTAQRKYLHIASGANGSIHAVSTDQIHWYAMKTFHNSMSQNIREITIACSVDHEYVIGSLSLLFGEYNNSNSIFHNINSDFKIKDTTIDAEKNVQIVPIDSATRRYALIFPLRQSNLHYFLLQQVTSPKKMLQVAWGIVQGLHYLHDNSILHLDMKPANILMSKYSRDEKCTNADCLKCDTWCPGITDFGCAAYFDNKRQYAHGDYPVITKRYRPVELPINDKVKGIMEYQDSMDIWSLGIILLEMFSYRYAEILYESKNFHPASYTPNYVEKSIHHSINFREPLKDLINKCLLMDAVLRPTMGEIIEHPLFSEVRQVMPIKNNTELRPVLPLTTNYWKSHYIKHWILKFCKDMETLQKWQESSGIINNTNTNTNNSNNIIKGIIAIDSAIFLLAVDLFYRSFDFCCEFRYIPKKPRRAKKSIQALIIACLSVAIQVSRSDNGLTGRYLRDALQLQDFIRTAHIWRMETAVLLATRGVMGNNRLYHMASNQSEIEILYTAVLTKPDRYLHYQYQESFPEELRSLAEPVINS